MNKNQKINLIDLILLCGLTTIILIACSNHQSPNQSNKNNNLSPTPQTPTKIITAQKEYNYQKMQQDIKQLSKHYDSLTLSSFGRSLTNKKLYLLKLGTGPKKIAVVGGVHGRESITSLLILKLIEDYIQKDNIANYKLDNILKEISFYFIPMLNPDGIEIATQGLTNINLKSKEFYLKANEGSNHFQRWKANGRGVDLNKQFPAHWRELKSKTEPHFAHYKGPRPESEPESKALADLTRQEDFAAVVAFHSSGQVIYWYYNQSKQQYHRDYQLAQKLSQAAGYKLVSPQESDKYAAGYKDWFIKEFKRPGFTIEIGKKNGDKSLPFDNLEQYWHNTRTILLTLAANI